MQPTVNGERRWTLGRPVNRELPFETEVPFDAMRGRSKHRRTQSDYMAALLDRVTLEIWGEIVDATVAAAKSGDARARAWLADFLVGKPQVEAPTPLAVIVQRIRGSDELVNELAYPVIGRQRWSDDEAEAEDAIKAQIAAELAERVEESPALPARQSNQARKSRDIGNNRIALKCQTLHAATCGLRIAGAARVRNEHGNQPKIRRVSDCRLDPDLQRYARDCKGRNAAIAQGHM